MDAATADLFLRLGVALGIGLLIGLQRESTHTDLAGLRTFPLVALAGLVCGHVGPITVAAGLLALTSLALIGNVAQFRLGAIDPGLTTEVALLLVFALGAWLSGGPIPAIVAIGATTAALLQFKDELHGAAARLGGSDLRAIVQFAVLSLVILPVLPDRAFGPYAAVNPREAWLMVVLIVGLSLAGYIAYRFLGATAGVAMGGILGGLASSTATTASWSRLAATTPTLAPAAAVVVCLASTIVFGRVLLVLAALAPAVARSAALPTLTVATVLAGAAVIAWRGARGERHPLPAQGNPSELRAALVFAALFAVVKLATAAALDLWGARGLHLVVLLAGLTDVDAITLSLAGLAREGHISVDDAWRLVLSAVLSNLAFKGTMAASLGGAAFGRRVARLFLPALLAGAAIVMLWP